MARDDEVVRLTPPLRADGQSSAMLNRFGLGVCFFFALQFLSVGRGIQTWFGASWLRATANYLGLLLVMIAMYLWLRNPVRKSLEAAGVRFGKVGL